MPKKTEKFSKLLLDEETGNVIDNTGEVLFNIKKQKPHEQSQIISAVHKIWDFFDLSDDKVLGFIKRHTIERFKRKKADFDIDEFIDEIDEKGENSKSENLDSDEIIEKAKGVVNEP